MNIFWMLGQRPAVEEFAWCTHLGTWGPEDICSGCGASLGGQLQAPFIVEWERGSTHLGDFTVCGAHFLVNERARKWLETHSEQCTFTQPQYQKSKYKKNTIQPEVVPPLWWVSNQAFVHLDIEASKLVESDRSCFVRKDYDFKYEELIIHQSDIQANKVFHIHDFGASRMWFCTQDFAESTLDAGITNIRFELAGSIID